MKDRQAFEADLACGLRKAARASGLAMRLDRTAPRAACLGAATDLAATIRDLEGLRVETAERLRATRSHNRSQRAYSEAANLSGRKQGDRR